MRQVGLDSSETPPLVQQGYATLLKNQPAVTLRPNRAKNRTEGALPGPIVMKDRPWIWIIVAHVAVVAVLVSVIVIAQRHRSPEVPLNHGH